MMVGLAGRVAQAQDSSTASVVAAFSAAVNAGDVDQLMTLFRQDAVVQDGSECVGMSEVRRWAAGLVADQLQIQLAGDPAIGPSAGDPAPGEWIIWSARLRRAGARQLRVDPLDGSLAAIVHDGQIAYLSLRPHFLWARRIDQEQSDEPISRAQRPVPTGAPHGSGGIPPMGALVPAGSALVAVAIGLWRLSGRRVAVRRSTRQSLMAGLRTWQQLRQPEVCRRNTTGR
ncbi:MAG: hypothetical protein JOZ81_34305 [Chloroflexi bacterium]|nr:hypothetical protein [Chloroflexota bacterium]